MALLRKAIPVISLTVSGRFWIFVRGLQFCDTARHPDRHTDRFFGQTSADLPPVLFEYYTGGESMHTESSTSGAAR